MNRRKVEEMSGMRTVRERGYESKSLPIKSQNFKMISNNVMNNSNMIIKTEEKQGNKEINDVGNRGMVSSFSKTSSSTSSSSLPTPIDDFESLLGSPMDLSNFIQQNTNQTIPVSTVHSKSSSNGGNDGANSKNNPIHNSATGNSNVSIKVEEMQHQAATNFSNVVNVNGISNNTKRLVDSTVDSTVDIGHNGSSHFSLNNEVKYSITNNTEGLNNNGKVPLVSSQPLHVNSTTTNGVVVNKVLQQPVQKVAKKPKFVVTMETEDDD